MNSMKRLSVLAAGLAVAGFHVSSHAGYVARPVVSGGTTTLAVCNPKDAFGDQSPTLTTCKVTSLPGLSGYIQKATRSANIVVNGVTIGTLYDRVWCVGTGTTCSATNKSHILGMRVKLNANAWDLSGNSFEINDLFRTIRSDDSADIAYFMGTSGSTNPDTALAFKFLEYSGRTLKGLNEPVGGSNTVKATNNGWIEFRADTNANDPDGISSPWSPWVLVRQNCPSGFTGPQTLKVRFWQGGEEDQSHKEIYTSGYRCN